LLALVAAQNDSVFSGVRDFFNSGTWLLVRNLSLFFVVVFWLAVAYWVFKDARRRIEDPWLVAMATVLGLALPFIGAFVYMLFRPPEYLEEVRERELEMKAMEERLAEYDLHCPVCRAAVKESFLVCPVCTTKLKQACVSCKQPLEPLWQICPLCETPVATPAPIEFAPTTTTARRRRRASESPQRASESPQ
jgi:RNA polymerase subunit RPABC4/transcription elongation factor Spt4